MQIRKWAPEEKRKRGEKCTTWLKEAKCDAEENGRLKARMRIGQLWQAWGWWSERLLNWCRNGRKKLWLKKLWLKKKNWPGFIYFIYFFATILTQHCIITWNKHLKCIIKVTLKKVGSLYRARKIYNIWQYSIYLQNHNSSMHGILLLHMSQWFEN